MPKDRTSHHAPEAFEAVALPHYAAVYHAAQSLTRNPSAAQDLVQDTYLRAYRFWHRFAPGTHARAWLFTILRHTHINGYRQRARQPVWVDVAQAESVCAAPAPAPTGPEPGTVGAWLGDVVQDEVQQALAALPAAYRQVVLLADLEDYSYKDIAAVVGCPMGTVMSRLYRGRQLLRQRLEPFARASGYIQGARKAVARPLGAGGTPGGAP
jgi:RNA polymerase sigma-70 factor (ECF subfamily)